MPRAITKPSAVRRICEYFFSITKMTLFSALFPFNKLFKILWLRCRCKFRPCYFIVFPFWIILFHTFSIFCVAILFIHFSGGMYWTDSSFCWLYFFSLSSLSWVAQMILTWSSCRISFGVSDCESVSYSVNNVFICSVASFYSCPSIQSPIRISKIVIFNVNVTRAL